MSWELESSIMKRILPLEMCLNRFCKAIATTEVLYLVFKIRKSISDPGIISVTDVRQLLTLQT